MTTSFSIAEFLRSGIIVSLSPKQSLIAWGDSHSLTHEELNRDAPAFFLSDFFLTSARPWTQYTNWKEISNDELRMHLKNACSLSSCQWTIHNPEQFKIAFDELFHHLRTGNLKKGVPYLFANSSSTMSFDRLKHCLKHALVSMEKKGGSIYGHWNEQRGILGVTPELLFFHSQSQPRKVHTMALAGTCPISKDHREFIKNKKERHEHDLVIEGIYQSLASLGTVRIGSTQFLRLTNMIHLMTPIEIDLHIPFSFDTLVRSLHPTPALGAYPIVQGKRWLEEYQKHTPRHYYGTPFGYQYPKLGISNCLISIRNVQWNHSGLSIGAGCGVVPQSRFDKEWQEIQIKIRSTRNHLNL